MELPHEKLRAVAMACASAALVLAVAVMLSAATPPAATQSAATALGDLQGVPAGWTGHQYPMPTDCYDDQRSWPNKRGNQTPCSVSKIIGIFSAHLEGSSDGTSMLLTPVSSGGFGSTYSVGCGGGDAQSLEGGSCASYAPQSVGSAVYGTPGDPVSLEWSCQPYQNVTYTTCIFSVFGHCVKPDQKNYSLTYSSSAAGMGFSASGLSGTATVPFPSSVQTVTLQCDTYPPLSITLDPNIAPPSVTITGNGANPTTATVGSPVRIVATFSPVSGDTLLKTAINNSSQNAVTTQTASSSRTYVFTPAKPGTYTFYPAVQTEKFPSWNNYNKSLTVTADCPAGSANSGGTCVVQCVGEHRINPPTCGCDTLSGYSEDSQTHQCVRTSCPLPNQTLPTCACAPGYKQAGDGSGSCAPVPPILSLSAAHYQVRQGTPASIFWNVTDLIPGAGQTCTIRSNPASALSLTMPAGTAPSWSGNQNSAPIQSSTIFTLACTGAPAKSITITEVPAVQEI